MKYLLLCISLIVCLFFIKDNTCRANIIIEPTTILGASCTCEIYDSIKISDGFSAFLYSKNDTTSYTNKFLLVKVNNFVYKYDNVFDENLLNNEYLRQVNRSTFILGKESGQGCKFRYAIYIELLNSNLYVIKIFLESKCQRYKRKHKVIKFKKQHFFLKDFTIQMINTYKNKYDI